MQWARDLLSRCSGLGLAGGLVLLTLGCVPLPVLVTPSVAGRVVDQESGRGVPGAIVVVRFDARYGDLLPERDLVGHREAVTDVDGSFRVARVVKPGLSAWPQQRTEARVVGVMEPGYLCTRPRRAKAGDALRIRLTRAADLDARRASCRPLAARPDEAPRYLAAWRALYPQGESGQQLAGRRDVDRILEARASLGFGQNCTGPAIDLALSPDGERVAIGVAEGAIRHIEIVDLTKGREVVGRVAMPAESTSGTQRLAWASERELMLWEPSRDPASGRSTSGRAVPAESAQVIWQSGAPASAARTDESPDRLTPILPMDLHDAAAARWRGRSFEILRGVDPETGASAEKLRIEVPDEGRHVVSLPGEACGPLGEYGRPHFRIAADGQRGLDLRYVDGGCRGVAVDLATGAWQRLDRASGAGLCRESRRIPRTQLEIAMRGYLRDVASALEAAGGDPEASYDLQIAADGTTRLESRDYMGTALRLSVPPFPLKTPLRRIGISSIAGSSGPASRAPTLELEPL